MKMPCAMWWRPGIVLQLIMCLAAVECHITADNVRAAEDPIACPLKCECERVATLAGGNLDGGAPLPSRQLSLAVYCYRGGLDDADFLNILQTIPTTAGSLEIVAPLQHPNTFQWNDNLNRLSKLTHLKVHTSWLDIYTRPTVWFIQLVNCRIPTLSQTIRLPLLRHLTLSSNRIDQLQIGPFLGLAALERLDLSGNNIDTLSTGAFLYLKKLKALSLSHNNLHTLAAGLLSGPRALEELELDGNPLGGAKQLNDLFSDAPHLRRLEINDCQLGDAEISELQLVKVPELRRLGIGGNKLTRVPIATVRALPKLSVVDLSGNAITRLEPCAFCSCNISTVLLRGNLLGATRDSRADGAAIDPEAFADTRIHELDLSFNQLRHFSSNLLYAARPTLRVLHLSGNSLHHFDDELIEALPQLTHLHMASNGIREFPSHSLGGGYRQLSFLNLSSNHLELLPPNMGSLLPELRSLDVSRNNLSSFSHTLMTSLVERLDDVHLSDNPWECECAAQPLQQYMLQRLNHRTRLGFERTLCASPPLLRGQPLHRVHRINDCAVFFGSGYGLTEASELLLLLATLLVAAFLVSVLVILFLYCGREHKQKALYITGDNGTHAGRHPLANGDIKANGRPLSVSHSLDPETLLLSNGYSNHATSRGNFQKAPRMLAGREQERRHLINNTDHNFNTLRSPPPPPPPPLKSTRLVTF